MSYTIDLIVAPLPENNGQAWQHIEKLRECYYDDTREKSPSLIKLYTALTAQYPCLSGYGEDDSAVDASPWADGPMLDNFAHDMGMLAIASSQADAAMPFIIEKANALGITVADGQTLKIYRPSPPAPSSKPREKSWWKIW